MDRTIVLLAVADRAYAIANDGQGAPDYRWMDQYINEAAKRYSVTLTEAERSEIAKRVRGQP